MVAQGFTAVNGLDQRPSISEAMPSHTTGSQPRPNPTSMPVREDFQPSRQFSIRNDSVLCSDSAIKQSPDTAKRKRLVADTIEQPYRDSPASAGALSPKRRMTDAGNKFHSRSPEGPTLNLLNSHVTIETFNRERCSRERSPVPTRNQRVAPPQVRPETQAHLAESLATHLQDAYNQTPENDDQQAPITTRYNKSPSEAYSPDEASDPSGKRKRNFSNRTKTGCHTCRGRKKKCDEAKPVCNNCARGGFDCTGYGPKPLGYKGPNASNRTHVPLQSKVQDAPEHSPTAYQSADGPRYDHWGRMPPTPTAQDSQHRLPPTQNSHEERRPHSRDIWRTSSWQHRESDGPSNAGTLPPVEYNQTIPPIGRFDYRPSHEGWRQPYHASHNSLSGPAPIMSSRDSMSTHSSHNPPFSYMQSSETSERQKMLLGEPYRAHLDSDLLAERRSCKAAVERWNQAHDDSRATSDEEKGRLFKAILDPSQRRDPNYQYRNVSRPGTIGSRVIIDNPFTCDYGYNIHIADDVYIGANCTIEDPCDVYIGRRAHIGKNVHFCGTITNDDPVARKGSQSVLTGGAIFVEDDVIIGPGTIVLAHRVIGKGASVGAGSVVTKNIPAYTLAAGNPCRVIRTLPRPETPEQQKRLSRELTAFTTISSIGSGNSEDDLVGDKQLLLENEQSLREMRARRGVREQGK